MVYYLFFRIRTTFSHANSTNDSLTLLMYVEIIIIYEIVFNIALRNLRDDGIISRENLDSK